MLLGMSRAELAKRTMESSSGGGLQSRDVKTPARFRAVNKLYS
jgi:hypothetical protein